jgi:hypothetical protein
MFGSISSSSSCCCNLAKICLDLLKTEIFTGTRRTC